MLQKTEMVRRGFVNLRTSCYRSSGGPVLLKKCHGRADFRTGPKVHATLMTNVLEMVSVMISSTNVTATLMTEIAASRQKIVPKDAYVNIISPILEKEKHSTSLDNCTILTLFR